MPPLSTPFADVVDAVDRLTSDEQRTLVAIVQRRLSAERRKQIVADVTSAREECQVGKCSPASTEDVMREILSPVRSAP
jgi:hypothetical protein